MNRAAWLLALALVASLAVNAVILGHRLIRAKAEKLATFDYYRGAASPFESAPNSTASIIVAGDSIADKCPWSEYLGRPIMSRGIVGETSGDLVYRIDELKRHSPKLLIILTGANDIHAGVSTAVILGNIRKVASKQMGIAPRCLVLGVLPADPAILNPAAVKELDDALSREYGASYVAPPSDWDWNVDTFDGLHPNGVGYLKICAGLKKRI